MRRAVARRVIVPGLALGALALSSSCATAPGVERLDHSSVGCMRAVVATRVPGHVSDKHAHCLAAGFIARYCSRPEAYVASVGKEVTDLFRTRNDFEWGDLTADRIGIRCERAADSDAALERCCIAELTRRRLPVTPADAERAALAGHREGKGEAVGAATTR